MKRRSRTEVTEAWGDPGGWQPEEDQSAGRDMFSGALDTLRAWAFWVGLLLAALTIAAVGLAARLN